MRLLVTGGSGFTGRWLVGRAVAAGHEVAGLARSHAAASVLRRLGAQPLHGDLDDPGSLHAAFTAARADCLLNIASMGFGHGPVVAQTAEKTGIARAVFVSTTAVTTTLPAGSKAIRLAAEEAVKASSLEWTLLRPTMIYGAPGDRNLSRLLKLLCRTSVLPVPGGGHRLQQPVHVDDVAQAILAAAESADAIGRTYTVAGPQPITFRQLLLESAQAVGRGLRLIPTPLTPCVATLRLYERLARRPRLKAEQLLRLAEDKAFDITPARRDLRYEPRSFARGIREEARLL